jgi:hypothetical protein
VFTYPSGKLIHFITSCFECEVTGGNLKADNTETLDVAFFHKKELPSDLLPMHPQWLSDALSGKQSSFIR